MYNIELNKTKFDVKLDSFDKKKGTINGKEFKIDYSQNDNEYHLIYNHQSYILEVDTFDQEQNLIILKINNEKIECQVSDDIDILLKQLGMDKLSSKKVNDIKAPMPGMVLDVLVDVGQTVKKGDTLVVLEAMKMENNIKSPIDGKVVQIACKASKAVEKNDLLVVFE
ncbi:MAG: acetyl-CoA carboxylase biotin carboxyl carrier protein subunit [Bacteroidales bacterium]|nr:acetyl-CoA carboxylase biotin carboxyl carrier protein subunit [Bacteroidales bacterium]